VIATDGANSLLSDMKEYLLQAQKAGVYVFFVLWNGAVSHRSSSASMWPPRMADISRRWRR